MQIKSLQLSLKMIHFFKYIFLISLAYVMQQLSVTACKLTFVRELFISYLPLTRKEQYSPVKSTAHKQLNISPG